MCERWQHCQNENGRWKRRSWHKVCVCVWSVIVGRGTCSHIIKIRFSQTVCDDLQACFCEDHDMLPHIFKKRHRLCCCELGEWVCCGRSVCVAAGFSSVSHFRESTVCRKASVTCSLRHTSLVLLSLWSMLRWFFIWSHRGWGSSLSFYSGYRPQIQQANNITIDLSPPIHLLATQFVWKLLWLVTLSSNSPTCNSMDYFVWSTLEKDVNHIACETRASWLTGSSCCSTVFWRTLHGSGFAWRPC